MPTPTHPDATGYIAQLAAENGSPWFLDVAKMATTGSYRTLPQADLDRIAFMMRGGTPAQPASAAPAAVPQRPQAALGHIEWLGDFTNFKRLPRTLVFKPARHVTVVFGKNGSGKTSLCDAFKVLANPEEPKRPLGNVRSPSATTPTFKIKFSGEATERSFAKPCGSLSNWIRYFDTSIANHNIQVAVAPERVVQLAPFKLGDFDALRGYVTQIKTDLSARHGRITTEKASLLGRLQANVGRIAGSAFHDPRSVSRRDVDAAIAEAGAFPGQQVLADKLQTLGEMEKASTAAGLKVLHGEIRDIERLLPALVTLIGDVDRLWSMNPGTATTKLGEALARQQALTAAVVPAGMQTDVFIQFLRSAGTVCDLGSPTTHTACPLCRQQIGATGEALFKQYNDILIGAVEREIAGYRKVLADAKRLADNIPSRLPTDLGSMAIEEAMRDRVVAAASALLPHAKQDADAKPDALLVRNGLHALISVLSEARDRKKTAYAAAETGAAGQAAALVKLKAEVGVLTRQSTHAAALADLRTLLAKFDDEQWLLGAIGSLTPLLKQVSVARRKAHDELVLDTFVDRLNDEYRVLSDHRMEDLGVTLVPKTMGKGEEAEIVLEGLVSPDGTRGGKLAEALHDVLSEGEQRLHALALFFAEIETSNHQVIVFDDPASSFDYDRVENYGIRLRNFANKHQNRQIIVLTHCWEFFVHLQQILKHPLAPNIQVLENCATVAEYADDVTKLKAEIEAGLRAPDPLTDDQKTILASKMRRLIEEVVNDLVFSGQRQQYKDKSVQKVSVFNEFTRVVPLRADEAQELADLYRKLSHSEHADYMNHIVNANKAVMRTRYDGILAVAAKIAARVPPR